MMIMAENYKHKITAALTGIALLTSCADDVSPFRQEEADGSEMRIEASIDQMYLTRAGDNGFVAGDAIGVYAVNYTADGKPGTLAVADNQVNNVKFTLGDGGAWESAFPIYFKDKATPADVYGYYPFIEAVESVNALPYEIERDQREAKNYEKSDFLWAKAENCGSANPKINLSHRHIMAAVEVSLVKGEGFEDKEWTALEKSISIDNTLRKVTVDLSQGKVTALADGGVSPVIPATLSSGGFKGIVAPQSVKAGATLITITLDGQTYEFKKEEAMTYHPGKLHRFGISVSKRLPKGDFEFTLISESITPWEADNIGHAGATQDYIVIDSPDYGKLGEAVAALGIDPKKAEFIKLTGKLTASDFSFIRENFKYLRGVNMKEAKVREDNNPDGYIDADGLLQPPLEDPYDVLPSGAFFKCNYLTYVIMPDGLKRIGSYAFAKTRLSGTLIIPETVTRIDGCAFNCYGAPEMNITGELRLPEGLTHIDGDAFRGCQFTGELRIPDNVTYIGSSAFARAYDDGPAPRFKGQLRLPSGLKHLGEGAFYGLKGLSGTVRIPQAITEIPHCCFTGTSISQIIFHDGVTKIGSGAFRDTRLSGDLVIPASVTDIENEAFFGSEISHLYFKGNNIEFIKFEAFANCKNLQDTVRIPEGVVTIEDGAFRGDSQLTAVVLPSSLERIRSCAFMDCFTLDYIHSNALTPPEIAEESVFAGVAKDNFTVEVPKAAIDAYRSAQHWNEFKRLTDYRNFVARPAKYNVLNAGGSRRVVLNADGKWSVSHIPSWCRLSATSGDMKTELTLTIDKMSHGSETRHDSIVFRLDDGKTTRMDIGQYDYEHDEDALVTLSAHNQGAGIPLVIVGEGYDASDIASGNYLSDMNRELEYLFDLEPYKTYKGYFDIQTRIARSEESGMGGINTLRETKFGSLLFANDGRLEIHPDETANYIIGNDATLDAKSNKLTGIVVLNTPAYDGITTMYSSGLSIAYVTKSEADYPSDARGLIQHEAGGHGFGKLADEYMYHMAYIQTCKCVCCEHLDGLLGMKAMGWARNLSADGKYKTIEWRKLIFDPQYSDIVDIYEGGYFHSRGVFRSEYNSVMNNNVPYLSTVSRMAIVERIKQYAGEKFDYDDFKSKDSREWGRDFTGYATRTESAAISAPVREGRAPIIIKRAPKLKKN